MELSLQKLTELIDSAAKSTAGRARSLQRILYFIRAFGASERVDALHTQRKVFADRGLVAVDSKALAALHNRMQALASSSADALADSDVEWLRTGTTALRNSSDMMTIHNDPEPDDSPEFTIPDHDLDKLLNYTAMLLGGDANMDVGLAWSDALQTVLVRLSATDGAPDVGDVQCMPMTRYRVHMVVDNVLGRVIFRHFKSDLTRLVEILGSHDVAGAVQLFQAFEKEFDLELSVEDRRALLEMDSQQVAEYFNRRIEKEKVKQ